MSDREHVRAFFALQQQRRKQKTTRPLIAGIDKVDLDTLLISDYWLKPGASNAEVSPEDIQVWHAWNQAIRAATPDAQAPLQLLTKRGERIFEASVLFVLALLYHDNRSAAIPLLQKLNRGKNSQVIGLGSLIRSLGLRRPPVIQSLARTHPINRFLGRVRASLRGDAP